MGFVLDRLPAAVLGEKHSNSSAEKAGGLELGRGERDLGDVLCQGTVEAAHGVGMKLLGLSNQLGQVGHCVVPHMGACLERGGCGQVRAVSSAHSRPTP